MARSISRVVLLCGLMVFAAAEGCQRAPNWDLAQVEGTVTKDGHPLPHVQVSFLADLDAGTQGPQSRAFTDESGHYRLANDNGGEGAVVGKHRVLIAEAKKGRMGPMNRLQRGTQIKQAMQQKEEAKGSKDPLIPPKYGRFNETPLRVEVHPGPQTLDFEIR